MLSVSEIFGVTLQGEGVSQGKPAMFLRLGLCNLDCSWCDTPYTWDWTGKNGTAYDKAKEVQRMALQSIIYRMPTDCNRLVITGGEPMVQQTQLLLLMQLLRDQRSHYAVEIETNGTIVPDAGWRDFDVQFNVSPKLANSGIAYERRINIETLKQYATHQASFKFVVEGEQCIEQIADIADAVPIKRTDIWLMPQGRTAKEILEPLDWLFTTCVANRYNLSTRLHCLTYDDKRGV